MVLLKWLLTIPLLIIGFLMGFSTSSNEKRAGFPALFLKFTETICDVKDNLHLKMRKIKLYRVLNHKILAMFAWARKVEDKTYALVGGAGIFVSEELPVI